MTKFSDPDLNELQPTQRFSNRVTDYIRYRSGYPAALVTYLEEHHGLQTGQVIADIGAGTGLLTQCFLAQHYTVLGIEPNREMRAAAESFLANYGGFTSIEGQAEATTLASNSVDWIVAGQAFHWFDKAASRQEFQRILRLGGQVALIWNDRLFSDPFQQDYENFLLTYCPNYSKIKDRRVLAEMLDMFFAPQPMETATFENIQRLDFEGLKGRLLSCSYAPVATEDGYAAMLEALRSLFQQYSHQGQLAFRYTTRLHCARLG